MLLLKDIFYVPGFIATISFRCVAHFRFLFVTGQGRNNRHRKLSCLCTVHLRKVYSILVNCWNINLLNFLNASLLLANLN